MHSNKFLSSVHDSLKTKGHFQLKEKKIRNINLNENYEGKLIKTVSGVLDIQNTNEDSTKEDLTTFFSFNKSLLNPARKPPLGIDGSSHFTVVVRVLWLILTPSNQDTVYLQAECKTPTLEWNYPNLFIWFYLWAFNTFVKSTSLQEFPQPTQWDYV